MCSLSGKVWLCVPSPVSRETEQEVWLHADTVVYMLALCSCSRGFSQAVHTLFMLSLNSMSLIAHWTRAGKRFWDAYFPFPWHHVIPALVSEHKYINSWTAIIYIRRNIHKHSDNNASTMAVLSSTWVTNILHVKLKPSTHLHKTSTKLMIKIVLQ